jgi:aspartate 1-decarboxylase
MLTQLLKAKIHHATVTFTDVNYHGSITIDTDLLRATGLLPNEAVIVADCENGNRFTTYIIPGEAGSGVIGVNGAAARLTQVGNRVIVMSFVWAAAQEIPSHKARVVICDKRNRAVETVEHASTLDGAK